MLQITDKTSDAWSAAPFRFATPAHDPCIFAIEPMGDDSMAPRYQRGEQLYAHSLSPLEAGNDVAIYLKDGRHLVRRLVERHADGGLTVWQISPEATMRIEACEIDEILPIVGCLDPHRA